MTEIRLLDTPTAVESLRAAGAAARGFLGVDPTTQDDVLLARALDAAEAQLFRVGDAVVGAIANPEQPRQAVIASTSPDPDVLRAFLGFLGTYQRRTSCVAFLPAGSEAEQAFEGCGFRRVGLLRQHWYQAGEYRDVVVHYARTEDACRP